VKGSGNCNDLPKFYDWKAKLEYISQGAPLLSCNRGTAVGSVGELMLKYLGRFLERRGVCFGLNKFLSYFCCPNGKGSVVQLVRMPPCHGGGRGFESRPVRKKLNKLNRSRLKCTF
jgi:hypothetical protein